MVNRKRKNRVDDTAVEVTKGIRDKWLHRGMRRRTRNTSEDSLSYLAVIVNIDLVKVNNNSIDLPSWFEASLGVQRHSAEKQVAA